MGNILTSNNILVAGHVPLDKESTGRIGYITTLRALFQAVSAYFKPVKRFFLAGLAKT